MIPPIYGIASGRCYCGGGSCRGHSTHLRRFTTNPSSSQLLHSEPQSCVTGSIRAGEGTRKKSVQAGHVTHAHVASMGCNGGADGQRGRCARFGLREGYAAARSMPLYGRRPQLEGEAGSMIVQVQLFKKGVERNPKSGSLLVAWACGDASRQDTQRLRSPCPRKDG